MLKALPSTVWERAFPDDPDFPRLKVAADPELMRELFRRHLKPLAGTDVQIRDCTPFRFRCRQSTARCVLQYTLRIAEPGPQREWNQWVTGLIYADTETAGRLWRKMQSPDPRRAIPESWLPFEPVEFIPELRMVLVVFPYDHKLPHLPLVLGGGLRELDPLLLSRLGPGRWQVEH